MKPKNLEASFKQLTGCSLEWARGIKRRKRAVALCGAAVLAFAPILSLQAAEQGSSTGNSDAGLSAGSGTGNSDAGLSAGFGTGESDGSSATDSGGGGGLSMGTAPVEIYTYEELLQIAEDPEGSYRLMDNINMEGQSWEPVDFSGIFDGNGYTLLNLEVNSTSAGGEETYDGNYKVYDTCFAGLFGTLKGAEVSNLNLVNIKVQIETDKPCFIGSIAGYSSDSTVRGCKIQGRLELSACDRMFGVGGIIGYGSGVIEETSADMTLICIDTDAENRDEQFMGGAYAAGYIDLNGCNVIIDGYDSDHGYVHSGGLVGMYILYPRGFQYGGYITNNSVKGKITFFEDNTNRRAYCKEYIGEVMNWTYTNGGNHADFQRDERYDYSVDLRPDMCVDAVHHETVTEPGCDTFGYTTITCEGCGYAYTDHYTLYRHSVEEWVVTVEPTVQDTGVRTGACALCGTVMTEEVARLDPPEETPVPETDDGVESADRLLGADGDGAASADQPLDGNGTGEGSSLSGHEGDGMNFPGKAVGIGVTVVMALILLAGGMLIFRLGKRKRR